MKAAIETLDSMVVKRPKKRKQNLCLDKGYDFPEIEREAIRRSTCRTFATGVRKEAMLEKGDDGL